MKKTTIFIMTLGILFASCEEHKYTIKNSNGDYYRTDSYEITEDGCIKFKDACGCDDAEGSGNDTKICGSYTITENKIEK